VKKLNSSRARIGSKPLRRGEAGHARYISGGLEEAGGASGGGRRGRPGRPGHVGCGPAGPGGARPRFSLARRDTTCHCRGRVGSSRWARTQPDCRTPARVDA